MIRKEKITKEKDAIGKDPDGKDPKGQGAGGKDPKGKGAEGKDGKGKDSKWRKTLQKVEEDTEAARGYVFFADDKRSELGAIEAPTRVRLQ